MSFIFLHHYWDDILNKNEAITVEIGEVSVLLFSFIHLSVPGWDPGLKNCEKLKEVCLIYVNLSAGCY